jgi:hypothetical protein
MAVLPSAKEGGRHADSDRLRDPHTRQRTLSRRDRRARRIGWAADFPGQPQRSAGPAQSGGQNSTSASELRWRPRSAPRSPKSSVSAQSWQRSAIVAIVGNVSRFPSKAHYFASSEEAWRRSRPQAGRWSDTGSRLPATAASTRSHAHDRRVPGSQRSHARRGVPSEEAETEGKSRREAMRCLHPRRVSDAVYGALVADSGRASLAPA